jgi:D-glycero-D-manno-heptose 1,7-bisphosphate phosphatase
VAETLKGLPHATAHRTTPDHCPDHGLGLSNLREIARLKPSVFARTRKFRAGPMSGELYAFSKNMKRAVFIERDGILNEVRSGPKNQIAPLTLEEFKIKSEAEAGLRKLKNAGFLLIVTTNQPGLSRGYQSRRELDRMHDLLRRSFPLDDILVCPHDESDHCPCRKPRPGLLIESAFKWHLNLDHSFVISDKWQDAEAARTAGCTSVMLQSPWVGQVHHDFVLTDLNDIVEKILSLKQHLEFV